MCCGPLTSTVNVEAVRLTHSNRAALVALKQSARTVSRLSWTPGARSHPESSCTRRTGGAPAPAAPAAKAGSRALTLKRSSPAFGAADVRTATLPPLAGKTSGCSSDPPAASTVAVQSSRVVLRRSSPCSRTMIWCEPATDGPGSWLPRRRTTTRPAGRAPVKVMLTWRSPGVSETATALTAVVTAGAAPGLSRTWTWLAVSW